MQEQWPEQTIAERIAQIRYKVYASHFSNNTELVNENKTPLKEKTDATIPNIIESDSTCPAKRKEGPRLIQKII